MINATIKLTVPPEKRTEIIQTFKAILGPIRLVQGCLSCNCYVDIEAENNLLFREEWSSREDLDSHLKSSYFGVLAGAMKLLTQEPVIRINFMEPAVEGEALESCQRNGIISSS